MVGGLGEKNLILSDDGRTRGWCRQGALTAHAERCSVHEGMSKSSWRKRLRDGEGSLEWLLRRPLQKILLPIEGNRIFGALGDRAFHICEPREGDGRCSSICFNLL